MIAAQVFDGIMEKNQYWIFPLSPRRQKEQSENKENHNEQGLAAVGLSLGFIRPYTCCRNCCANANTKILCFVNPGPVPLVSVYELN